MGAIDITGNNILELREKKSWLQQDLANLLKVDVATIVRWEKTGNEKATIQGTSYAVLLPILLGNGIKLRIADDWTESIKPKKTSSSGLMTSAITGFLGAALCRIISPLGRGIGGALLPGAAFFAPSVVMAIFDRFLTETKEKGKKRAEGSNDQIEAMIFLKEVEDAKTLFLEMEKAWKNVDDELEKTLKNQGPSK